MSTFRKIVSVTSVVGYLFNAGCSANADGDEEAVDEASSEGRPIDPTSTFSSAGLVIERQSATRVEGTFEHEGAAVRFDFGRDGEARTAVVTTRDGAPLVSSRYDAGIDTSEYFGGKAKAVGVVDEEPRIEGDANIIEALSRSDARVLPRLKEALIAAKVDRAIFSPAGGEPPTTAGTMRPQSYYYNGWNFLDGYDDSYTFWSWSFWGTTTVVMANGGTNLSFGAIDWNAVNYGEVRAYVKAGCCSGEWVEKTGVATIGRQWWGAQITVTNKLPTIAGMTSCATVWAQVGTQCAASHTGTVCSPVYGPVTSCSTTPSKRQRLVSYKY
jgi:hypothetical protein